MKIFAKIMLCLSILVLIGFAVQAVIDWMYRNSKRYIDAT